MFLLLNLGLILVGLSCYWNASVSSNFDLQIKMETLLINSQKEHVMTKKIEALTNLALALGVLKLIAVLFAG